MPGTCTQCGNELPRDDARFCSNCGAPVASPSSNAGARPPQASTPPHIQPDSSQLPQQERRHVLREQIAHQPRPARLTRDISLENKPSPGPLPQTLESEKPELRVRVWNQENAPAKQPISIDELPTQETPASPIFNPSPRPETVIPSRRQPVTPPPVSNQIVQSRTESQEQERRREQIAQQSTSFMSPVTNLPVVPSEPRPTPFLGISEQPTSVHPVPLLPTVPPTPALYSVPPTPIPASVPVSSQPSVEVGPSSLSPLLSPRNARRGPAPLVLLGVVILALIIAGVAWVTIAQPFNVPAVTRPLQDYRDTHVGVALSYPSDWTITHTASSVLFSDSSQTAQTTIAMLAASDAPNGNIATYLQQQAAKLNMSGAKTITQVSFAGTTWQKIQGSVQKNGVNDTETLFATVHNNHLYVLTQSAPQTVYADEETLIFSKMRASLQLL